MMGDAAINNGPRGYNCPFADINPIKNYAIRADPHIVFNNYAFCGGTLEADVLVAVGEPVVRGRHGCMSCDRDIVSD
jgi:hypothetical protein